MYDICILKANKAVSSKIKEIAAIASHKLYTDMLTHMKTFYACLSDVCS
jgi:hypothetical protein